MSVDIPVSGSTDGFVAAMVQAGTVTEREAQRIVKQIGYINSVLRDAEKQQRVAGAAAAEVGRIGKAAQEATGPTAGFTRELIVMAHEVSQGQFSQLGGSFLVLTERSAALTNIVHALISPLGVLAGAAALVGLQVYRGAHEQEEFNKSLLLTGNYAGQTAQSMHDLAKSIAAASGQTIGSAKEAAQALVSSGVFGPRLLQQAGQSVATLSHLTGQTAEEVVKDFSKMQDGVAKWAEEHNRTMHFLSAAQYEYIKDLEGQGKAEAAEAVVLKALNDRLDESSKHLGYFAKAWSAVKDAASSAADAMGSWGKDKTLDEQIAEEQQKLAKMLRPNPRGPAADLNGDVIRGRTLGDRVATEQRYIQALIGRRDAEKQAAQATSEREAKQAEAIASSKVIERINQEIDHRAVATRKIEEYTTAVKKMRDAGDPKAPTAKQEADTVAAIRDKYRDQQSKALDTRFADRLESLRAEGIRLQTEVDNWKKYGKAVDDSRLAVLNMEITQGKLKGVSPAQIKQLRESAAADDETARRLKALEAASAFKKQLDLATVAVDKEVASLESSSKLIGANTLERQKAADAIKVQAEAERLLAQGIGKEAEINAWAAEQVRKLTQARQQDYDVQRKFSTGAANAFAKYQEDATNSAKFAENFINGSMSRMEDALTNFVETGKLSFKNLFQFMAEEFIRQQIRMQLAKAIGPGSFLGGLGSILGGASGGAGVVGGAAGTDVLASELPTFAATGINYVPRDNMPFILHKGEAVVPAAYNPAAGGQGAGGDVHITQHISVGEGVSTSQLYAACVQAKDAAKTEILQSIKHRGVYAS